jgi:hypothetical protein
MVKTRTSPRRSQSPKRESSKSATVAKFISVLFHSREQAHILHLQTNSYAQHKALGKYYESIVDLADKYVETYQGKYGLIKGYTALGKFVEGPKAVLPYFKDLTKKVAEMQSHLPKDLDLENAYADILQLIHSTNYLLNYLH